MKLLILTQKIDKNDSILGFFHRWVEEFAKNVEKVIVICLEKGEYNLPPNVEVLSLGKEKGVFKLGYVFRFYKYIWQKRAQYGYVFVHMNQIYVILGGFLWRLWGKKIALWYAHGHTSFSLKIAEKLSHLIFTSTKSGFRLKSNKTHIVGQGIDIERFNYSNSKDDKFQIIVVGRISSVKDYETLINAIEIFSENNSNFHLDIIGGAVTKKDNNYLSDLMKIVKEKQLENFISFKGAISNTDIPILLSKSDLFVSTSNTGSLDKAILEAMASFIPVLTCNEALIDVLGSYKNQLMFEKGNHVELAEKIKIISQMNYSNRTKLGNEMRKIVENNHSLKAFVKNIIMNLENGKSKKS